MDNNVERIECYLRGVIPPEHECGPHRQQLRRRILDQLGRRQVMFEGMGIWRRMAAVVLIAGGILVAATMGMKIQDYRLAGGHPGRDCAMPSADKQTTMTSAQGQVANQAGESPVMVQPDNRNLVHTAATTGNGRADGVIPHSVYNLSKTRPILLGMMPPEPSSDSPSVEQLQAEIAALRRRVETLEKRLMDRAIMIPGGDDRQGTMVIQPPDRPSQVPKNWVPFEFNGMQFYIVPLGAAPAQGDAGQE